MHKTMLINFFNSIFAALNLQFMLNLKKILLASMAYFIAITAMSQLTTGTITGTVKDGTNAPLVGTSIEVTHEPSGSKYKSVSTNSGKYTVPGLRIGGPYKIVFTYVGLKTETITDVYIQLGEPSIIDVSLSDAKSQLLLVKAP